MSNTITVYKALARTLGWNPPEGSEWEGVREARLDSLLRTAPRGAGVCTIHLWEESKPERMVFEFDYHHDDDENPRAYGYTNHKVRAYPCPQFDFRLTVTGWEGDYKTYGTRDYLGDLFHTWLSSSVEEHPQDSYEESFWRLERQEYEDMRSNQAKMEAGILVSGRGVW